MLNRVLSNKHTSFAATVVVFGEALSQLAKVWWPSHQAQVDETVRIIQKAAVGYGLYMAGDAKCDSPAPTQRPPEA